MSGGHRQGRKCGGPLRYGGGSGRESAPGGPSPNVSRMREWCRANGALRAEIDLVAQQGLDFGHPLYGVFHIKYLSESRPALLTHQTRILCSSTTSPTPRRNRKSSVRAMDAVAAIRFSPPTGRRRRRCAGGG